MNSKTILLNDGRRMDSDLYYQRMNYWMGVRDACGLQTTWSIYDRGLRANDPIPPCWRNLDGPTKVQDSCAGVVAPVTVQGTTILDLWRAVDKCVIASGDLHHVFIEGFEMKDGVLDVILGS